MLVDEETNGDSRQIKSIKEVLDLRLFIFFCRTGIGELHVALEENEQVWVDARRRDRSSLLVLKFRSLLNVFYEYFAGPR